MAAKFTVPDAVREILARSTISADRVVLPDGQLDRKLYEQVNKALAAAGGKWNRSAKAHVFTRDPREALGLAIETGKAVNERQARQAFYTPDDVADRLARAAGLGSGTPMSTTQGRHIRVLEPSCGEGALMAAAIRATKGYLQVDGFEIDLRTANIAMDRVGAAMGKTVPRPTWNGRRWSVQVADFLVVEPKPDDLYDVVLMNPPFAKNADVQHVTHAWKFLRPGGTFAAIMSPHWTFAKDKLSAQFREFVAEHEVDHFEIPSGTFEHTDIATVAIVLRRGE